MTTFEDVKRMIDGHDYTYQYSDDHRYWQKGQKEYDAIQNGLNSLSGDEQVKAKQYWKRKLEEWWG
jgi:hypothetical protein